eukprot:GHVT01052447.1.p2 GENE.GHVT01052447.1~~GHVT01052447.1.p2  ORF type:complete len:132 (+),score=2.31 GHVT01052447.1:119-514(+)
MNAVQAANSSERNYFLDFPSHMQSLAPIEHLKYRTPYLQMSGQSDADSGDSRSGDESSSSCSSRSGTSPHPGAIPGGQADIAPAVRNAMAGLSIQESAPVDLRTTLANSTPRVGDSVRPDLRLLANSTPRV